MISFLLSHRTSAAGLLLAVTAAMAWCALSLRVDPGAESVIPTHGADLARLREFNAAFGPDEAIVLALHSDRLFSAEGLRALDDLTRRAAALPHAGRVLSPTNARDLDGDELGPFPVVPYEKVTSGAMAPEEMGRRLAAHPIFGGLLVSPDARTAAVIIEVRASGDGADHRAALVRQVRDLASGAGPLLTARVAGLPVEKVDVAAYVERDQMIFVPLVFAVLIAVTLALYRHPVGVAVPMSVVLASLLWTLGLYALAGRSLNPVTSLMTPVVLVVSVAGAIHLLNHHLAARAEGLPRPAALERAFRRSHVPCFNAALTTAIGFASLLMLPIPAIRDFGLFTAAGVMIAYGLTMTLGPVLLGVLPDFPPRLTREFHPGTVERRLKATAAGVCRHPVAAAAASLVVAAVSIVGLTRMRVETDLIHSLRPGSPLFQATRFIDEHLTGVNSMEILIGGVGPDDPAGLLGVERFERALRRLPGVRKVVGLPDLYARLNRARHGGDDAFARLPEGPEAADDLAEIRDTLKEDPAGEVARFVSVDGRTLRLAARVTALDTASSQELFRRIREAAGVAGLPGVTLTGNFVVLSDMATSLVRNQVRGLGSALVLILAAMAVQFRSLRLGLLSAIPNGMPVLMVYGLMGWTGIALSVPTAMIASVAIGMTVDNTIHLMARFREEFRRDADYVTALGAMMDASGRAVVFSTATVALGFLVGLFSSFLPSVHFAVLTGAALLLGLACEAVLLPLVLILFRPLGRAEAQRPHTGGRAAMVAVLLAAATTAPAGSVPPAAADSGAAAAPGIVLRDQFGRTDGPGLHRGEVLLLLYGKAASLRKMKTWEQRVLLAAGTERPRVLRGVDARAVRGKKTEAEVNERLRQNVPPEISLLVDWRGELARAFGLPDAEVSVTVLDPAGRACGTTAGPARDEPVAGVADLIARVRRQGKCPV